MTLLPWRGRLALARERQIGRGLYDILRGSATGPLLVAYAQIPDIGYPIKHLENEFDPRGQINRRSVRYPRRA